jgi:hypothetical protein
MEAQLYVTGRTNVNSGKTTFLKTVDLKFVPETKSLFLDNGVFYSVIQIVFNEYDIYIQLSEIAAQNDFLEIILKQ